MNFNKKTIRMTTLCVAGVAMIAASQYKSIAATFTAEKPVAGITVTLDSFYNANTLGATTEAMPDETELAAKAADQTDAEVQEQAPVDEEPEAATDEEKEAALKAKYENIGIAIVDNYLNVRSKASEDSKIIGKLPKNAGATIYGITDDGWAKIKSGKVTGYVMSSFLATGDEAAKLAKTVGMKTAVVNTTTLKVREKPSTDSECITLIPIEEELEVIKVKGDWVKVEVDSDKGWVAKEFVDISYELKKAVSNEEIEAGVENGVSSTRASMVAYAKQFLGNPYVWGGTSLTNGTDCSGFTSSIYRHFGYSISRTSRAQSGNGTTISASDARPGDLVFYSNGGGINHVAMCIGNGQVIHASNPRTGIKISNMFYRTPVKAVRIISD